MDSRRGRVYIFSVARPIESTPTLYGEDAEQLLRELANVCSPAEAKARGERGRRLRAEMMRPKQNDPILAAPQVKRSDG